jgi:hypothetical protein
MRTKFWSENLRGREFRRPNHRWEDNIRTHLKEIGGKVWTGHISLRDILFMNMVTSLKVP